MRIVVDEEIADAQRVFSRLGEVRLVRGRRMAAADVAEADALVVRSVTRVDAALLSGSRVRFVGTATSGTDHVDTAWLAANGIVLADAAGCNSVTVAEYVLTAILILARRLGFDPSSKTLGVVGVGRIGSIVASWAEAAGMRVLKCDPPLQRRNAGGYIDFPQLAAEADIVTLHVPLTRQGPDATGGMVDADWLGMLKEGAILLNTSRGEVVGEGALLAAMESGRVGPVVLDVWCHEPDIDRGLALGAALATPHVAGYSVESKRRAAWMIAEALARLDPRSSPAATGNGAGFCEAGAADAVIDMAVSVHGPWWIAAGEAVSQACRIEPTDAELRAMMRSGAGARSFDEIRRRFSVRRELSAYRLAGLRAPNRCVSWLRAVGFDWTPASLG
jgi:erythronate-4-phosphate dehydrogenase